MLLAQGGFEILPCRNTQNPSTSGCCGLIHSPVSFWTPVVGFLIHTHFEMFSRVFFVFKKIKCACAYVCVCVRYLCMCLCVHVCTFTCMCVHCLCVYIVCVCACVFSHMLEHNGMHVKSRGPFAESVLLLSHVS